MPRPARSPRRARLALALVGALALSAAASAPAGAACRNMWQPDPFGDTGGSLVLICDGSRPGDGAGEPAPTPRSRPRRRAPQPTRAQYRALRYKPSAAVSGRVRDDLTRRLAVGDQADAIARLIASGDLLRQAHANLRRMGWSTRDLGDAYALAYIVMWQVVNGRERTAPGVDDAARAQLRAQLALDRRLGPAKDAVQQEYAERLAAWTTVIAGSWNEYRRHDDAAGGREWRENARRLAASRYLLGVDLGAVTLTRRGIVKR